MFLIKFPFNDLPDDVVCNSDIYADDTTLSSKCDQVSDLWQLVEFPCKLESDLRHSVEWSKEATC